MTPRRARLLAGTAMGAATLMWAIGIVARVAAGEPVPGMGDSQYFGEIAVTSWYLSLGALLLWRRPENRMGLVFCLPGLLGLQLVGTAVSQTTPAGSLASQLATFVGLWSWVPAILMTGPLMFLLFPTGTPLSNRWRHVVRLVVSVDVTLMAVCALGPVSAAGSEFRSENPLHVSLVDPILPQPAVGIAAAVTFVGLVAGLVSLVLRFRRSHGVERQQLKWALYAASVTVPIFFSVDGAVGTIVGSMLLPTASVIAVLRYRLWDIDRIVSRTVTYTILTALIALPYAGIVAGVTHVATSDLAVALATLGAAAAFQPLRRYVQRRVDRRFNRDRYDAARTVEEFRAHLRNSVELDGLRKEVLAVVSRTVQPTMATLWLR